MLAIRRGFEMADRPRSDSEEQDDFARMMEESLAPKFHKEGETVEGTIVALGAEVAFVDIGGKGEATIDIEELVDPDSDAQVKVGDTVKAVVVSTVGGLRLSHKLARGALTRQRLNDAFQAGLPVEGRVEKAIKGGYEVRLGGQRAFCPISQIDARFTADPAVHVGQAYTFRIIECKEDGKELVVSRRVFLQADPWSSVAEKYKVGQALKGKVTRVADFGAFVELEPGIEALAHVSAFAPTGKRDGWKAAATPGAAVAIEILNIDLEKKRIGVAVLEAGTVRAEGATGSAAAGSEAPQPQARVEIVAGARLTGKVERLETYGVFVFLAPGRTGLIHVSETGVDKGGDLKKAFPPGSEVEVMVLEVDPAGRRIQLSRKAVLEAGEKREVREYAEQQEQAQPGSFGSLADKLRAAMRPPKK